jgi:hypothetical protein
MRVFRAVRTGLTVTAISLIGAACSAFPGGPGVASIRGTSAAQAASGPLSLAQIDQDFVDYTRCLRQHGLSVSDPYHRPGHQGLSIDVPPSTPQNRPALQACQHFVQAVQNMKMAGARQELSQWLPKLIDYARCMRIHDIAMPDPGPNGQLNLGPVPGISNQIGRYSPQFRSADAACRHLLPAAVHDDGTGP